MKKAQIKAICQNAFKLPGFASKFEQEVGKALLKAERKAGHKSKFPSKKDMPFGNATSTPEERRLKIIQLVNALKGSPPQNITELCTKLGYSNNTARKRANLAIRLGLVNRFLCEKNKLNKRIYLYEAVEGETY